MLMRRVPQHRRAAGDTIIEVLFALAIMAMALSAGYSLAGKTATAGRHAQERTEALKLVEGQAELLRAAAGAPTSQIFTVPNVFCLDAATYKTAVNNFGFAALPSLETDNFGTGPGSYPVACSRDEDGAAGADRRYKLSIDRGAQDQFAITARWERLGGGRDEVQVMYKVHR